MIILYTTHCPKCNILQSKLNAKNIEYTVEESIEKMQAKGIELLPCLEVDGEILQFAAANKWVNSQGVEEK